MKGKTVKRLLVTFLVNRLLSGTKLFECKRRLLNGIGFSLGEGTRVVGPIFCSGRLETGKDCWLGRNLKVHGNGIVVLGDRCDIAPDVTFLTGGHAIGTKQRRAGTEQLYTLRVGDGCWIGARATLGKSIRVGAGSVIAACACVMQDVRENTLAGGVPAREIGQLDET